MDPVHNSPERPTHPVRAVLFDYGKVLTNAEDQAAWAAMLALTGVSEGRFHVAYWTYRHDYDRHTLDSNAYWRSVADHAGTTFSDTETARLKELDVDVWTNMNDRMVEFALNLQRAGVRTGVLSNIGDAMAQGIVARLPWLSTFYHCTWSYALGLAKPEPAIYLRTAEALDTPPEYILFLDDREENVAAASALGFQTILFTDYDAFLVELRDRGYTELLQAGSGKQLQPA
jgi:putative hydrolase of the HAD superfamily